MQTDQPLPSHSADAAATTETRRLHTRDVAQTHDLGNSTVREWADQFGIPHEKRQGRIVFESEHAQLFGVIKQLKEKGAGFDTIRQKIGTDEPQPERDGATAETEQSQASRDGNAAAAAEPQQEHVPDLTPLLTVINSQVEQGLLKAEGLAEKFSRVAHQNGVLEERVRNLQELNDRQAEQLRLLPAPTDLARVETERDQSRQDREALADQLGQVQAELQQTRQELEKEKSRSWLDRLLGR